MNPRNYPADIRKIGAEHMRDIRAMFPDLKGNWSRKEWNNQARFSGWRLMERIKAFRAANTEGDE